MSSRPSTPVDSDDDIRNAMTQETPTAPRTSAASKRNHAAMAGDDNTGSDDERGSGGALPLNLTLPNQNVVAAAKHYAEKKRLRGDQLTELGLFLKEPASLREAKLLTNIFALGNQLEQVVASKPSFELSPDLETNIQKYAPAILLSDKIASYKGECPTTCLTEVIKRLRFIPDGLENIPADWGKVVSYSEYSLTQRRSKIKKVIRSSLKPQKDEAKKTITYANDSEHHNIFELTTAIVKGTQCTVNITLCSRVALMRKVYLKHPGTNFWDMLDEKLENIRNDADGDAKKLVRGFRHVLEQDQAKHGKKNYKESDIQDKVDPFQKKVDDLLEIDAMDTATSAQLEDPSGDT
ncbi:hypothetical protein DFH08DRAFT_1073190 [Mycena albidolilacea]|uniref:Uncharacterized protein n=1 Tax=Mycena albidolilacea TaxID=1033008 RepID=A0AAD7APC1_9AGAR|nr:hypothetical protein DFH08DRAFT_1088786 [Mycena albidolilacea]KAJ7364500.1 hypothetical protein DFH08DRAFT_1073190 [Mycena albidolilacea]